MIGSTNKTSEDVIIEYLAEGSQTAAQVHKYLTQHQTISLQAVYDQLRKLVTSGVLLKNKKEYILSTEWTEKLHELFAAPEEIMIREGESLTYTFKNLQQADAFWKHVFSLYGDLKTPVCIYNPHCFWVYLYEREQSEIDHYRSYAKKKQQAFFLIGDETPLDYLFKKTYADSYFKVNCKHTTSIKQSNHLTILGDIIINSKVSDLVAKKIDALYTQHTNINSNIIREINDVTSSMKRVVFKIERNREKAAVLQKIITRDFMISHNIKKHLLF